MASSKYVGISGGCIQEVVDYEFGTYVEGQNFFEDCGPIDEEDSTINEQQLFDVREFDNGEHWIITKAARKHYWVVDNREGRVVMENAAGQNYLNDRWGFYGLDESPLDGSEYFFIVNADSKQCMEIADGTSAQRYRELTMEDCDTRIDRQKFYVPDSHNLGGGRARIENVGTRKYLGISCFSFNDGDRVGGQPYVSCGPAVGSMQHIGFDILIS